MIQDRIAKIEATLSNSPNIPAETRQELLTLLGELKAEVTPFASTHDREAQSLTEAVEQATREGRKPEESNAALEGLASSVRGFEASHPKLVQIVDRLALTLSNMGI